MSERSGVDVIAPANHELVVAVAVLCLAPVAFAVLAALDLRRRGVTGWWVVTGSIVLVPPFGLFSWAVLRYQQWKRSRPVRNPGTASRRARHGPAAPR